MGAAMSGSMGLGGGGGGEAAIIAGGGSADAHGLQLLTAHIPTTFCATVLVDVHLR